MYVFKERKSPIQKDFPIIPNGKHFEIEIESTFHLKNLYKHTHDWLQANSYYDPNSNDENFETLFLRITKSNGLMFHHIWWRVIKKLNRADSKNFHIFLKVNFQTIAVSKHETMIEGKKFQTYKGDVILRIKGYIRVDPEDRWNDHPILKYFQKIMIERWLKNRIEEYKKYLYNDMIELNRQIKHYMGGKTGLPTEKQWNESITGL